MPVLAVAVAAGYILLAFGAPTLLLALAALAVPAACALAPDLTIRRRWLLAGIGLWLAVGLTGAWWLRAGVTAGMLWMLATLFLLPLPIMPWLYARTFGTRR
ncbi:MAG TPA: hypothetical protein PLS53_01040 [Thermoanaerobaculaceae bacterium]|nr:hypothetical protein [Thermoanaerobaculaceae bacterium]